MTPLEEMEKLAREYAKKHTGLDNPKDNRCGRIYRAYLAGCRAGLERAVKSCGTCGGTGEIRYGGDELERDECSGCSAIRALIGGGGG